MQDVINYHDMKSPLDRLIAMEEVIELCLFLPNIIVV